MDMSASRLIPQNKLCDKCGGPLGILVNQHSCRIWCSVKATRTINGKEVKVPCGQMGIYIYIDKGRGEIVVCPDHKRMYDNIEVRSELRKRELGR